MNKPKFKVGDRVRVVKQHDGNTSIVGKIGTIRNLYNDGNVGVEFDEYIDGHNLHVRGKCKCKYGYGWYCPDGILEPVNDNKIVITTDGKTTTAKMYDGKKLVNSAKAICSPDDEFDFNIGAAIALERLTGYVHGQLESTLEETWYNGKVVCVDNVRNKTLYTSGKIYEFKDGYMINNDNMNVRCRNFKQFMNFTASKFIEVVE